MKKTNSKQMSGLDRAIAKINKGFILTKSDLKRFGILEESVKDCFTWDGSAETAVAMLEEYKFTPKEIMGFFAQHDPQGAVDAIAGR